MEAMMTAPDSALCRATMDYARRVSTPCLFHHVMRTHGFGVAAGEAQRQRYDPELFFVAAVLHDLGLSALATGASRFEIEGADLAQDFLAREGMADKDIELVWDAIALHTSVGLAERKGPEAMLVQIGAGIDVGFIPTAMIGNAELGRILTDWPRLNFKEEFPREFVRLLGKNRAAAMSPVTAGICTRHVHGFAPPPDICDVIAAADFDE